MNKTNMDKTYYPKIRLALDHFDKRKKLYHKLPDTPFADIVGHYELIYALYNELDFCQLRQLSSILNVLTSEDIPMVKDATLEKLKEMTKKEVEEYDNITRHY